MKNSKITWIITGIIVLLNILAVTTSFVGEDAMLIIGDSLPVLCSLIALLFLIKAYNSFEGFDLIKLSWLLITIGLFLNMVAEATYGYLEIVSQWDMNEIFPTLADIFWTAAYVPLFAGVTSMYVNFKSSGLPFGNIKIHVILSVVLTIIAFTSIYFLLVPIINDPETTISAKIFSAFYPIADFLLVIPSVLLLYITSMYSNSMIIKPLQYMTIGFLCIALGDISYSILRWLDNYDSNSVIDLMWNFGYLSFAIAAAYQRDLINSLNNQ